MPTHDDYWKLLETESRFNTIQATIRGVAATWLLATITAIGLLLRIDASAPNWAIGRGDLILAVLAISSLGLVLLWILDLQAYQRLLGATFSLRLHMEFRDPTLPPLAAAMMASSGGRGMTRMFHRFYAVPVVIFLVAGGALVAMMLVASPPSWDQLSILLGRGLALGGIMAIARSMRSSKSSSIDLSQGVPDPDFQKMFGENSADLTPVLARYVEQPHGVTSGGVAGFELAPGEASTAMLHKTVEAIWFILKGRGEVWQRREGREEIQKLRAGSCLTVPVGTPFQFRARGKSPLSAMGVTAPMGPGAGDADTVPGKWEPTGGGVLD